MKIDLMGYLKLLVRSCPVLSGFISMLDLLSVLILRHLDDTAHCQFNLK